MVFAFATNTQTLLCVRNHGEAKAETTPVSEFIVQYASWYA